MNDDDQPPPCECVLCRDDCRHSCQAQVCDYCQRRVADHLADFPDQYRRLSELLEPGSSSGPRITGTRDAPVPLRLAVLNLLAGHSRSTDPVRCGVDPRTGRPYPDQHGSLSIVDVLFGWEQDWRQLRGLSMGPTFHGDTLMSVAVLSGFLRRHLEWACGHHPAMADFGRQIAGLRHAARVLLDDWDGDVRIPERCPNCETLTLVLRAGSAHVECTTCRVMWSQDQLERLGLILGSGKKGQDG